MSQIFISYASEDKERVKPLAERLQQEGWSVWWDRYIPPGKSFDEVIEEELGKAICVIVLWSENSVRSRWVKTEAGEGDRREILVPALIDEVSIPFAFRRIQAAKLLGWPEVKDEEVFNQFLDAVRGIISESEGREKPDQIVPMNKKVIPQKASKPQKESGAHKDIDRFLKKTHEMWLSGNLSIISKSFFDAATNQGITDFSNELKESYGKGLLAVLNKASFSENEYLVGAGGEPDKCSFVLTSEMLYLFVENKTNGPITEIIIKDIVSYELKTFWNIKVMIELRTGQKLNIKGMSFAPKEEYIQYLSR